MDDDLIIDNFIVVVVSDFFRKKYIYFFIVFDENSPRSQSNRFLFLYENAMYDIRLQATVVKYITVTRLLKNSLGLF